MPAPFSKPGIRASPADRPSPKPSAAKTIPPAACPSPSTPASTSCPPSTTTPWPTAPTATSKASPLFAFGDGLSYTTFAYSDLKLSTSNLKAGDPLTVEAEREKHRLPRRRRSRRTLPDPTAISNSPKLALAGFQRLHLNPGETKHLTFTLDPRTLSQVDEKGTRAVTPGNYKLSLGSAQPNGDASSATQTTTFAITGTNKLPN